MRNPKVALLTNKEFDCRTMMILCKTPERMCELLRVSPEERDRLIKSVIRKMGKRPGRAIKPKQGPTARQLEDMRLFAEGKRYAEMSRLTGYAVQTLMQSVCNGCKAAGVNTKGGRRAAIARYLSGAGAGLMDDPMF